MKIVDTIVTVGILNHQLEKLILSASCWFEHSCVPGLQGYFLLRICKIASRFHNSTSTLCTKEPPSYEIKVGGDHP